MAKVRILPSKTLPPDKPHVRVHDPKESSSYTSYRDCLRWEFGFTCPFCLTHEADLDTYDADGSGQVWIEHLLTQSKHSDKSAIYTNCVSSCRYCNRSRGTAETEDDLGRKLLFPTQAKWSSHFEFNNFTLEPKPDDSDAQYTCDTYDLNSPRKVFYREQRQKRIDDIETIPALLKVHAELIQRSIDDVENSEMWLEHAGSTRKAINSFIEEIDRCQAIPKSAPSRCRCAPSPLTLPPWLLEQTVEVDRPDTS